MNDVLAAGAELSGLRILVTGAASGIGLAIAEKCEARGATVAWLDRNDEALTAKAGSSIKLSVDLGDEAETRRAITALGSQLGGLDAVVNAAGIVDQTKTEALTTERWQEVLAINLTGPLIVCQAAKPLLAQSPHPAIVNIASASGILPSGSGAAYSVSKAGLLMLTKSLAAEWAPHIRVNAICPGTVDTPMLDGLFEKNEAFSERLRQTYALGRMAKAEEIAEAAIFLLSPKASFVTGISMAVDGGRTFH